MAYIINLKTNKDIRGKLTVIEKNIPFEIKRIFYIYDVPNADVIRGGHRHHKNIQALIAVSGKCVIYVDDGIQHQNYILDTPDKCLILEPKDWHIMQNFEKNCVLLVLASEYYGPDDYISEPYKRN